MMISVSAEDDAIALPQPKVWNAASVITSVSGFTFNIKRNASPQLMEPTSPMALASVNTFAFLGLKK